MVHKGDCIQLTHTTDPYTTLESGDTGTVTGTTELPPGVTGKNTTEIQIDVDWDDGGSLSLIKGEDEFRTINNTDSEH